MADTPMQVWYRLHGCDHAHCPNECEHPQPFLLPDGRMVCGRCAILDGQFVEMIPCTPETCGDDPMN
jgi:hypothetical protein